MASHYKNIHPLKYYRDFLAQDVRPDGRTLDKARTATVNVNSIGTADGSAIARVGNTTVVCGIKAELGKPKADEPESGFVVPNVELPPLCSPLFRPGPPSEQAQALSCFVAEVASVMLNRKQLCICTDNLVWVLHIDMICLDYDGCVPDACIMALVAALRTVSLPCIKYDLDTKTTSVSATDRWHLSINVSPICLSYAVFDEEKILTDPTGEEERLSSSQVNIVSDGESIFSVHKRGGSGMTESQLQECISDARCRAVLLKKLIDTAISDCSKLSAEI